MFNLTNVFLNYLFYLFKKPLEQIAYNNKILILF